MTDNDFIKVLENCVSDHFKVVVRKVKKDGIEENEITLADIVNLIKRQKAENERLQKAIKVQEIMLGNQDSMIKKARAEVAREIEKVATINLHTGEIKITYPDYIKLKNKYTKEGVGE